MGVLRLDNMGMPQFLRRVLIILLIVPFVALVVSHSIPWNIAYPQLACPLDSDSSFAELDIDRFDFPEDFVFGAATAAYQFLGSDPLLNLGISFSSLVLKYEAADAVIFGRSRILVEGAAKEGGRGPSIWDTFSHTPGKTEGGDNGDVAADQYHLYQDDVDLLKAMHMGAYRFSISWSRIIPDGQGPVNEEGIAYYNRLIDALLSKGVQPYATLYHWDLPQALHDSFNGWVSKEIVPHFGVYAEACFSAFGDRVKHWITFNEPQQFAWNGYGTGVHAPGRTSDRSVSPVGDSATEPYLVAHHTLLSHATAVDIYRTKFQATQGGSIGITVDCEWGEPMTEKPEDVEAAERRRLFQLGWFLDPIFFGDYPEAMRARTSAKQPEFSTEEKSLLSGSVDFIGLNHYTSRWITNAPPPYDPATSNYWEDQCMWTYDTRDGVLIGPQAFSEWLYMVPWGIEKVVEWVWARYKTPIFLTENGMDTENVQSFGQPLPADFDHDEARVNYYHDYLTSIIAAMRKGADVRGYFAWSLLDNFEWAIGYTSRFGLFYVDYSTLKRYPKDSAQWWAKFLSPRDDGACQTSKFPFVFDTFHVRFTVVIMDNKMLGLGSGQPNRVKNLQIAVEKAGYADQGAALASDAFFPFAWNDAVEDASKAGVKVI